ncbi:MAG: glutaredoxin family protein [Planctomycetota bacterium]|nr:glutaredoxin family protein [Planctomycetota bacterium]
MAENAQIQLYSASWCPDCTRAIRFLDQHEVAYEKIDISEDPDAAELLEAKTGKKGIPFLVVGNQWVRAYTPGGGPFPADEICAALGIVNGSVE